MTPLAVTSGTTFTDTSAIAGIRYFYVVEARNVAGSSLPSNEASAIAGHSAAGGHRFAGTPDGHGGWLVSPAGTVTPFW